MEEKEALYQALRAKITTAEDKTALEDESWSLDQELESMLEKLNILEVQSEVNLPDVRWAINNAMGASRPPPPA